MRSAGCCKNRDPASNLHSWSAFQQGSTAAGMWQRRMMVARQLAHLVHEGAVGEDPQVQQLEDVGHIAEVLQAGLCGSACKSLSGPRFIQHSVELGQCSAVSEAWALTRK